MIYKGEILLRIWLFMLQCILTELSEVQCLGREKDCIHIDSSWSVEETF